LAKLGEDLLPAEFTTALFEIDEVTVVFESEGVAAEIL